MVNWDEIDRLVQAERTVTSSTSDQGLLRQLRLWWCIKYNLPFRSPLLDTYTLDDLVYEYLTFYYLDPEHDPSVKRQKELREKDDQEWARKMLEKHVNKPGKTAKPVEIPVEKKEPEAEIVPTEPPPDISTKF